MPRELAEAELLPRHTPPTHPAAAALPPEQPCRRKLEFVVTNGDKEWDQPNPYGEPGKPKNYVIEQPGTYRLKSGKLTRL